jgi:2-dehydro-3-deoxyphosphogluconate aldolase / (4S)-4-hydroxy-2-oxoglutarate aldolase
MILNQLLSNYVFAVIRGKNEEDAIETTKNCILGGIKNIEITFSTPNAAKVIETVVKMYENDSTVVIGAGTVMTLSQADEAINSGSKFLVSPHFSKDIMNYSLDKNVLYFPGCGTVTEIVDAMEMGAKIIKVFPGGTLGSGFIKAVHGPLPEAKLMPSGGVSLENVRNWKASGACAVGLGSDLTKGVIDNDYSSVKIYAENFIELVKD